MHIKVQPQNLIGICALTTLHWSPLTHLAAIIMAILHVATVETMHTAILASWPLLPECALYAFVCAVVLTLYLPNTFHLAKQQQDIRAIAVSFHATREAWVLCL